MRPEDEATQLPLETEDDQQRTGRKMDEEIRSLSALVRLLEDLPEPARCRAVAWIHSRYHAKE